MKKNLSEKKDKQFVFTTQSPTTKNCPYCGVKLAKIPKRKKKCPNCGNYIFVSKGKLFTEEEKDIRDWLMRFEHLKITRKMFNKKREKLSSQLGLVASVNDTGENILYEINKQGISEEVAEWKKSGDVKYVRWRTVNDECVCSVCRKRANKKFLLSEIENLYPAHIGCRCYISPIVEL